MYRSILVAVLLLVGGCVGTPLGGMSDAGSKTVAQAKTVGVISAVGSKFALQKVGITVFGNELNEVPIGSWGLDDTVASRVSGVLSKRFTVKRITVPQGTFAAYEKPAPFGDSDATLQSIVRQLAGSAKFDLLIVITPAGVPFGGTNQTVAGIGLVEGGGVINPDNVTLYAVTAVHLYDGRTFERLLWQRPGFSIGSSMMGNIVNAPHRRLDSTWWPTTPQALHSEKYKAAARTLLADSISSTIPEMMGLTGKKGGV
jgi:hypothetical protein